jgi:uncharacterized membrane protein YjfL (UPF0719 family)
MNTPLESWHATSIAGALGNMAIFAIAAVVLLFICLKAFDKIVTKIDLEGEIAKGNVAAAILTGSMIIAISIIIAVAMM